MPTSWALSLIPVWPAAPSRLLDEEQGGELGQVAPPDGPAMVALGGQELVVDRLRLQESVQPPAVRPGGPPAGRACHPPAGPVPRPAAGSVRRCARPASQRSSA